MLMEEVMRTPMPEEQTGKMMEMRGM